MPWQRHPERRTESNRSLDQAHTALPIAITAIYYVACGEIR
jgi:hypothetical protein